MAAAPQASSGARRGRRVLVVLPLFLCALAPRPFAHAPWSGQSGPPAQPTESAAAAVDREATELLARLEAALASGDPAQYLALVGATADRKAAEDFAREVVRPGMTRAVMRERDRAPLADGEGGGTGVRLIAEVFLQSGARSTVGTWRLDLRRDPRGAAAGGDEGPLRIAVQDRLTTVEGLHRLSLVTTRQYRVRNLTVSGEDLTLTLPHGVAFTANTEAGPTAFVLIGRGEMIFRPKPAAERGQIELLADEETLRTSFSAAFVRMNPGDQSARFTPGALIEERANPRTLGRAQEIFSEEVTKSFNLDLSDLSRETWSLVPPYGDLLVEVRTRRFGTLTYTQASNEAEDISLFDRRRRRNISSYASERKLATRARYYSENDEVDYDVRHYDIQSHFSPEREWIEGRTVLRLRVSAYIMGTLTLRLAESLVVQSVTSPRFGRLLSLRVKGQNSILVNLPTPLARGDDLTIAVTYAGRLGTAMPEREVIRQNQPDQIREAVLSPEPRMVYTNRSYWYPQATVTDYATASLRLTVPEGQACVATGAPAGGNPVRIDGRPGEPGRQLYVFATTQPARYLAVVITRLTQGGTDVVRLSRETATLARNMALAPPPVTAAPGASNTPVTGASATDVAPRTAAPILGQPTVGPPPAPRDGVFYDALDLAIVSNPRQAGRMRAFVEQTVEILSRYAEIVGDLPYPSFTLALVDDRLPGGHSPAYFALLHQPLPTTSYQWRNDPVSFDKFPQFFIAHELAHQYWGDAVGGENYHEQWISEGFAQFFALLHAERTRSKDTFEDIVRQMRRTSIAYDRYGPVWLGYRLGHLQGDSRVFRALVYNKGALVLQMLRRLMGDDAFFRGLRRFYLQSRFMKVGTDDVRRAFEMEAGRSLERYFERWIMQSGVPRLAVTHRVSDDGSTPASVGTGNPSLITAMGGGAGRGRGGSAAAGPGPGPGTGANTGTGVSETAASAVQAAPPAAAGPSVTIRFEQKGEVFEFPVSVRLRYHSGEVEEIQVPVTERIVERVFPLKGRLRAVAVNEDDATLVEVNVR